MRHLSYNDLYNELHASKPGDRLLYCIGDLGLERLTNDELDRVANLAAAISELGYGVLVCKRLLPGCYAYYVVPRVRLREGKHRGGMLQEAADLTRLAPRRII